MLHHLLVAVGVTDDAGALCRCAARFVRLLLSMVESAAFCELACRLGTQMFADFPQTHAFGLLQLRAFGSRKMLAYARSPPNFGGLTADKERMNLGVDVLRRSDKIATGTRGKRAALWS